MATPVWTPGMAKVPGTPGADAPVRSLAAVVEPDGRTGPARAGGLKLPLPQPWQLPRHGLAVFQGETPRLSHYFLPRLLLEGKRVLFLDGANCADPRLLERLARQRNVPFAHFNQQIQIARAFTCFQLTELIARVPQFLAGFPAQVLIVTAFPELYFDEDVRDWDARVAFAQALAHLRRLVSIAAVSSPPSAVAAVDGKHGLPDRRRIDEEGNGFSRAENSPHPPSGYPLPLGGERGGGEGGTSLLAGLKPRPSNSPDGASLKAGATVAPPLAVAVFSSTSGHAGLAPSPARQNFFNQVCATASEVWKFTRSTDNRLGLVCERAIVGATWQRAAGRGGLCPPAEATSALPSGVRAGSDRRIGKSQPRR